MDSHNNGHQAPRITLDCHLQVPSTAAQEPSSRTPNTPEILNSIVNMQQQSDSPFTEEFSNATVNSIAESLSATEPSAIGGSPITEEDEQKKKTSTASIDSLKRQLIKEELKMKVKERSSRSQGNKMAKTSRRVSKRTPVPVIKLESAEEPEEKVRKQPLTATDEERRQRRRERNKVAATKCRNKKKARTVLLMKENDTMTEQNANLKLEIARLEAEKNQLIAILAGHKGSCRKNSQGFSDIDFPPEGCVPNVPQPLPPISSFPMDQGEVKVEMDSSTANITEGEGLLLTEDPFSSICGESSQMDYYYNQAPFLGKGSIGMTYLDLDSRCTLAL